MEELSHLSNSSELASLADLRIELERVSIPLHSAVLAAQSKVLCTAFCTADGQKEAMERVVQQELEQHAKAGVLLFLSLVYNPNLLASTRTPSFQELETAIMLSHKLDASVLLSVSVSRFWQVWQEAVAALHIDNLVRKASHQAIMTPRYFTTLQNPSTPRMLNTRLQACGTYVVQRPALWQADLLRWLALSESCHLSFLHASCVRELARQLLQVRDSSITACSMAIACSYGILCSAALGSRKVLAPRTKPQLLTDKCLPVRRVWTPEPPWPS